MSQGKFKCVWLGPDGTRRSEVINAGDQHEAYRRLSTSGRTPIRIEPLGDRRSTRGSRRVSRTDVADLTRELAVLVEAKMPLAAGLSAIAEGHTKPEVAELVRDLASRIEAGAPFTEALGRHERIFGDVYIEAVRAAERSGSLGQVMAYLAEMFDRQEESRQTLQRAMAYPVVVLSVVAVAVTTILVFVVPRFAATFESQGMKLPLATRMVQGLGWSMREYWYAFAAGVVLAMVGAVFAWRTPVWRSRIERLMLALPMIGRIVVAATTARFTQVFGVAISSGLGLIEAVEIAGRSTGRPTFTIQSREIADRLRGGEELASALKPTKYLPPFAKRMLAAGKDSTELARASAVVAKHYQRECAHLSKGLSSLIEPLLTVVLAVIVLGIALSVFLPMWQMVRVNR